MLLWFYCYSGVGGVDDWELIYHLKCSAVYFWNAVPVVFWILKVKNAIYRRLVIWSLYVKSLCNDFSADIRLCDGMEFRLCSSILVLLNFFWGIIHSYGNYFTFAGIFCSNSYCWKLLCCIYFSHPAALGWCIFLLFYN